MKVLGLISLVFLISCSPKMAADQKNTSTSDVLAYQDKAYEVLKVSPIRFELNKSADYVLATYIDENKVPGSEPLRVAVLKTATEEVVYKQNLNNGSAKWLGDYIIEIIAPPGMPNGSNATVADYTYSIDVRTGKKVNKIDVMVK